MRTTLNLDDDVAAQLASLAGEQRRSLSRVANDLIRAGLRTGQDRDTIEPYQPATFDSGRPLVDVTDVAQALEVLERGD